MLLIKLMLTRNFSIDELRILELNALSFSSSSSPHLHYVYKYIFELVKFTRRYLPGVTIRYFQIQIKYHCLLAQFRCGILPLRIETGRYVGEKPEGRLCKICDSQQIEDETHFLLQRPFYSVLRDNLFSSIEYINFNQLPDIDKTLILMMLFG